VCDKEVGMSGTVDVIYPVGSGSRWDNNELRYSLRALEKNFLDLGRVFVCGAKPPWLTNVIHIDVPDLPRNKDANLIDKVLAACKAGMSDLFVRSSDDELILRPVHASDLLHFHGGNLAERGEAFFSQNPWHERLRHTYNALRRRGVSTWHFDTHIPTLCQKALFEKVASEYPYGKGRGYTINTWYLNHEGVENPPPLDGRKLTLERATPGGSVAEIRAKIAGKQYLGYNDAGLTAALKQVLQEMFPTPSRFETDGEAHNLNLVYRDTVIIPTVVAVLGAARSGTSCTAGILHALGVSMGEHLRPPAKRNQKGFYEAVGLRHICGAKQPKRRKAKLFRRWAVTRGREHEGAIIGGKDARLCGMIRLLVRAWPGMKVVAVDRPMAEIVNSMRDSGSFKRLTPAKCERRATRRIAARDRDIAAFDVPTLHLNFPETIADPAAAVQKIIAFLGITPTPAQIQAAIAFVDPSLRHQKS
jgi:hypothetical protein